MKKSLRRFICQKPTDSRIMVCITAHHRTLLLVSSLICRKRSSFSCVTEDRPCVFAPYLWSSLLITGEAVVYTFTLWYSCCLMMLIIWSLRCKRLFSRFSMLSLVLSELWSTGWSPIWISKCNLWNSMKKNIKIKFLPPTHVTFLSPVQVQYFFFLYPTAHYFSPIVLTILSPAKTENLVELVWKQKKCCPESWALKVNFPNVPKRLVICTWKGASHFDFCRVRKSHSVKDHSISLSYFQQPNLSHNIYSITLFNPFYPCLIECENQSAHGLLCVYDMFVWP